MILKLLAYTVGNYVVGFIVEDLILWNWTYPGYNSNKIHKMLQNSRNNEARCWKIENFHFQWR